MCLAVPGLVMETDGALAQVDFGGVRRRIAVALTPDVKVGDYVLVHAGYAIQVLDPTDAAEQLALIREVYGGLADEDPPGEPIRG